MRLDPQDSEKLEGEEDMIPGLAMVGALLAGCLPSCSANWVASL